MFLVVVGDLFVMSVGRSFHKEILLCKAVLLLVCLPVCVISSSNDFIDSFQFSMKWISGKKDLPVPESEVNLFNMTTVENETYTCATPATLQGNDEKNIVYDGPSEEDLLADHMGQKGCSYRIESYWTYELCHGKYLRQYHEEKVGKDAVKLQQYYLGFGRNSDMFSSFSDVQLDDLFSTANFLQSSLPTRRIEQVDLPYYLVKLINGTVCDISGRPRQTNVLYVCNMDAIGQIYELLEVSSCEYELVVLTDRLCQHPHYKPRVNKINAIYCYPNFNAKFSKPRMYRQFELENLKARGLDVRLELQAVLDEVTAQGSELSDDVDRELLKEFLTGRYCLTGGSGWWNYEFCYGKYAKQFHEDKSIGTITDIFLGYWDKTEHINWLKSHSKKRPRPVDTRRFISCFYSGGDFCELVNAKRSVEIKLKCLKNSAQPHAVSIYLSEPKTCQYLLVIESPILCPIILSANDETAIVDMHKLGL